LIKKIDPLYIVGINLFIGWRIALLLLGTFADDKLPTNIPSNININDIWRIWSKYDVNWYHDIAISGYHNIIQTAFFPLWPILINIFHHILPFIDVYVLAFLLANILTLLNILLFIKLLKFDYNRSVINWAIIYLVIFPTSLFFSIGYSEALFLSLTLSMFIFAKKNNWLLAGLFAALASATRPIGILLFIPLLIAYFEFQKINYKNLKRINWKIIFLFLAPLGLLLYSHFLQVNFHDPLAFVKAQKSWDRDLNNKLAWAQLWNEISIFLTFKIFLSAKWIKATIDCLFYILPVISIIYLTKWKKYSYASYVLLGSIIPLSTGIGSFNRFLITLFPIYIFLAQTTNSKKIFAYYLIPLMAGLLFIYIAMFVNGFWVA
jgi:hypothetical protein